MSCREWQRLVAAGRAGGMEAEFLGRTGSTNDDVLARLAAGRRPPFLVAAEEQDRGRGRMGRQWISPPGSGLWFTVALAAADPVLLPFVSLAAGAACAGAIERLTAARVLLKWPNDLYLDDRKLGGILCETPPAAPGGVSAVAVGVGVNVRKAAAAGSVSLEEHLGRRVCRAGLLEAMARDIRAAVDELWEKGRETVLARWRGRDWTRGRRLSWVSLKGEVVTGAGCGIDPEGRLLVRDRDGRIHPVLSGDITVQETGDR